jgi:CheY-like chemotaxis protein
MTVPRCVVLVVDDEEPIRVLLEDILQQLGYNVISADSGDAALLTLAGTLPIDVILTDIVMPGEANGFELIERARALRPSTPAIAMSGYIARHQEKIALADRFLHKPFTISALEKALAAMRMPRCITSGADWLDGELQVMPLH